jgi:hypothetical protein
MSCPAESGWSEERGSADMLSNRNVVEAILHILSQPGKRGDPFAGHRAGKTDFLN